MTQLIVERGATATGSCSWPATDEGAPQHAAIEVHTGTRVWSDPVDWEELGRVRAGVARIVTHACGLREKDGAWLDGPILVFARDGSVVAAIPSGGAARLELPLAALEGPGVPLARAVELERAAPWRCLRALVAHACGSFEGPLCFAGGAQDLPAALALFAARQAYPDRALSWRGQSAGSQPWRRFLHNAGITVDRDKTARELALELLTSQISSEVLVACLAGAHRQGKVVPAVLVRDGLSRR
jgi:hypothetical protein